MPEDTTETKSAISSKTIGINAGILVLYTIAKWVHPEFSIPEDVLVAGQSLLNIILRLITNKKLST